jgi:hypothetical protein
MLLLCILPIKKVEITTTMTTKVIILTAETTQHKVGRYGKRGT